MDQAATATAATAAAAAAVEAVVSGDEEKLTSLLDSGISVNTTDKCGCQLLHLAIASGNDQIEKLLLSRGATPFNFGGEEAAAAVDATKSGDVASLTSLLDAGVYVNTRNELGDPLLHVAAWKGHPSIVSLLLSRGADILSLGRLSRNALMRAASCKKDNRDVVELLFAAGLQVNATSEHESRTTALTLACDFSTAGTVAALLDVGADIDQKSGYGDSAVHRAALAGRSDIVTLLLDRGADISAMGQYGRNALMYAAVCKTDNRAVVELLSAAGLRVNATSENIERTTALREACLYGTAGTVAALLDVGADVSQMGWPGRDAIRIACDAKNWDIVYLLLEHGSSFSINAKTETNAPLLHLAAANGNKRVVSLVLEHGANINQKDSNGATPLYVSAASGALDSVKLLISKGANVNEPNNDKITPLAIASAYNKHNIVSLLLKHKADPDLADREGLTALHISVQQNSVESFKKLIAAGVPLDTQSITGYTALHFATSNERLEMLNKLVKARCNINAVNDSGNIALDIAASYRKTRRIKIFSDAGKHYFDIDESTLNTQRAEISREMAKTLLSNKADIGHRNNYGETPIALSTKALNIDIVTNKALNLDMVKLLYAHRADLKCIDNMHRGLIHKAVEGLIDFGDDEIAACKQVIEWLIRQRLSVNAEDINKQTPLHVAAKAGKNGLVSYLIGVGADITARDSFGHLPLMCALENPSVFQFLWDQSIKIKCINDNDFCTLQRLTHWLGLGHDLMKKIKKYSKTHISLENAPQKVRPLKCKYDEHLACWLDSENVELPDFMSDWLFSLQQLTYIDHPTINDVMWDFLKHLEEGVKKDDPLVAYLITRCGSVDEKTKVFAQDECDCSCIQENIKFHMFEEPTKPDHEEWTAFVHMKCKDEYVALLSRILDKQNRLSQGKLCHYFGKSIAKTLSKAEFWDKFPNLQRITPKDISAGDRRICTMNVIWSDEICPFLEIDIDLAPVVDLESWKPSWCNPHPLMHLITSIALPKWKITPDVEMDLMEIGVHGWGPLFHKMPEPMRQGYRLAKVVRGKAVCPQVHKVPKGLSSEGDYTWCNAGTFMNTYLLKQVIMNEFQSWYDQKVEGLEPQVHTDVYWARRIYEKMEDAFRRRELYSWYIPSYNLLTDNKFQHKDIAIMYAKLCRRLLTEEAAVHFRKAYMGGPVHVN